MPPVETQVTDAEGANREIGDPSENVGAVTDFSLDGIMNASFARAEAKLAAETKKTTTDNTDGTDKTGKGVAEGAAKTGAEAGDKTSSDASASDGGSSESDAAKTIRVGKLTFKAGEEVPVPIVKEIERLKEEARKFQSETDKMRLRAERAEGRGAAATAKSPTTETNTETARSTPTTDHAENTDKDPFGEVLAEAKALDEQFGTEGQFGKLIGSLTKAVKSVGATKEGPLSQPSAVPPEYAEGMQLAQAQAVFRSQVGQVDALRESLGLDRLADKEIPTFVQEVRDRVMEYVDAGRCTAKQAREDEMIFESAAKDVILDRQAQASRSRDKKGVATPDRKPTADVPPGGSVRGRAPIAPMTAALGGRSLPGGRIMGANERLSEYVKSM